MCVAETRESPFPPPPAPHPVKRRFRIFRTATRSGGMLILSADQRTNIFQPRTLFVERVSNALDFFFQSTEWYSFDELITIVYIYIYIFPLCVNYTYIFGKKLYNHVDTWSDASFSSFPRSKIRERGREGRKVWTEFRLPIVDKKIRVGTSGRENAIKVTSLSPAPSPAPVVDDLSESHGP